MIKCMLSIALFLFNDLELKMVQDTHHYDIQYRDTQYSNIQKNDTQKLSWMLLLLVPFVLSVAVHSVTLLKNFLLDLKTAFEKIKLWECMGLALVLVYDLAPLHS